eukprot:gnl/TRDRNA2_/TRDRNA2_175642_c0_seq13.p1 gnl/TRDRNA2_/TRDRNA2_175642_c0~~gnl/TRDRNA2_/TRDRNA2_175642_c0_seq13.p1  ORF type:complete len:449 (+),score=53.08 gnl/TRDRNA2_/TRDRNA2_175642_c0_seq13:47-1348(+)
MAPLADITNQDVDDDPRAKPGEAHLCWSRAAMQDSQSAASQSSSSAGSSASPAEVSGASSSSSVHGTAVERVRSAPLGGRTDNSLNQGLPECCLCGERYETWWRLHELSMLGARRFVDLLFQLRERHPSLLRHIESFIDEGPLAEYAAEMWESMHHEEVRCRPEPDYMRNQADINGRMRSILIDWLLEVHMKYRLQPNTLFLTISLIDRYLSQTQVVRRNLQLVGIAAAHCAAKFEEIHAPECRDWVNITGNAYTVPQLNAMECEILTKLNFNIVCPTILEFLERLLYLFFSGVRCDEVHREVAYYLIELSLLDMEMVGRYTPSHVAAAALLLSNEYMNLSPIWPPALARVSRYTEDDLRPCALSLHRLHSCVHTSSYQAVVRKYSSPVHHSVAKKTARLLAQGEAARGGTTTEQRNVLIAYAQHAMAARGGA